jgi:pimeloyl-ACP methyl ester carboxylesterase
VDWALQRDRITIVGSSLGGLTAAWITQNPSVTQRIERLVLLAPAFQFLAQWLPRLGTEALTQWATAGWLSLYHYGLGQEMPLAYQFITDAQQYDDAQLTAPVPTLILHGINDEVISVQASRDYAATRPWVSLVELISDHSLGDVQPLIWQNLQEFLPELSCGS